MMTTDRLIGFVRSGACQDDLETLIVDSGMNGTWRLEVRSLVGFQKSGIQRQRNRLKNETAKFVGAE